MNMFINELYIVYTRIICSYTNIFIPKTNPIKIFIHEKNLILTFILKRKLKTVFYELVKLYIGSRVSHFAPCPLIRELEPINQGIRFCMYKQNTL